ncbi:MAG: hypothetical protein MUC40_00700 [Akkermansiaceae bacterium]|jgi:hypothetical protein|nr:hypothetical protein [Akkermansiaceae bacterium]
MKPLQPEFPFVALVTLRRGKRGRGKRGRGKVMSNIQRAALKNKCARRILLIVETVAARRRVDARELFADGRGTNEVSAARVLALGMCCACDVPQYIVARAFRRTWQTVFSAEIRCSKLYREKAEFRKEWDDLEKLLNRYKP